MPRNQLSRLSFSVTAPIWVAHGTIVAPVIHSVELIMYEARGGPPPPASFQPPLRRGRTSEAASECDARYQHETLVLVEQVHGGAHEEAALRLILIAC